MVGADPAGKGWMPAPCRRSLPRCCPTSSCRKMRGRWVEIVFGDPPALPAAEQQLVREAGKSYFAAAAEAAAAHGNDLAAIAGAVRAATGKKGAALYMPLRAALTGVAHGPELAPLLKAMPPGNARERLARFA